MQLRVPQRQKSTKVHTQEVKSFNVLRYLLLIMIVSTIVINTVQINDIRMTVYIKVFFLTSLFYLYYLLEFCFLFNFLGRFPFYNLNAAPLNAAPLYGSSNPIIIYCIIGNKLAESIDSTPFMESDYWKIAHPDAEAYFNNLYYSEINSDLIIGGIIILISLYTLTIISEILSLLFSSLISVLIKLGKVLFNIFFAGLKKVLNYITYATLSAVSGVIKHTRNIAKQKFTDVKNKRKLKKQALSGAGGSGDGDGDKPNNPNTLPKDRLVFQARLINFLRLLLVEVNRLRRIRHGLLADTIEGSTHMNRIIELKSFTTHYHETIVRNFFSQFTSVSEAASDFILSTIWQGADISFLQMLEINSAELAIDQLDTLASNLESMLSNLDPFYVLDSDTDSEHIQSAFDKSGL